LSSHYLGQSFVRADFIAPALRDARRGTADANRADHLIADENRQAAGIRK
jgi:hypothetical protein